MHSYPEGIEKSLTLSGLSGSYALPFGSGGAPLRGDPRLMSVIPTGIEAEELSKEMDTRNVMSAPDF